MYDRKLYIAKFTDANVKEYKLKKSNFDFMCMTIKLIKIKEILATQILTKGTCEIVPETTINNTFRAGEILIVPFSCNFLMVGSTRYGAKAMYLLIEFC